MSIFCVRMGVFISVRGRVFTCVWIFGLSVCESLFVYIFALCVCVCMGLCVCFCMCVCGFRSVCVCVFFPSLSFFLFFEGGGSRALLSLARTKDRTLPGLREPVFGTSVFL